VKSREKWPHWTQVVLALMALLLVAMLVLYELNQRPDHRELNVTGVEMAPVYEDFKHAVMIHELAQKLESKPIRPPESPYSAKHVPRFSRPGQGIAIIIDDVGYDLSALERLLRLPVPIAVSVLPDAPKAVKAARLAHQKKHTVMLHMPMEPANPKYRARMDASFLRADMDKRQIQAMLRRALNKVPYVEGINNHMGSYLTTLEAPMNWVMEVSKQDHLFFVDSKTASHSIADQQARAYGLAWAKRSIFLDHSEKESDMEQAWQSALNCAERGHSCVVIGHPHESTLNFLERKSRSLSSDQLAYFKPVKLLLHTPD
jgi:polysaccharide deacetylase 2 family uncharacterized protein YibQ